VSCLVQLITVSGVIECAATRYYAQKETEEERKLQNGWKCVINALFLNCGNDSTNRGNSRHNKQKIHKKHDVPPLWSQYIMGMPILQEKGNSCFPITGLSQLCLRIPPLHKIPPRYEATRRGIRCRCAGRIVRSRRRPAAGERQSTGLSQLCLRIPRIMQKSRADRYLDDHRWASVCIRTGCIRKPMDSPTG